MSEHKPQPAYRIETGRLVLRCWEPSDAASVRAALDRSDAHLRPWVPFMRTEPRTEEGTVQWLRWRRGRFDLDEDFCYGVFDASEQVLLGEARLLGRAGPEALELGYWIDVAHTGNGYATEAVAALTEVAFRLHGVERVEISCAPENAPSTAIPRKLGFQHEATLRARHRDAQGRPQDQMLWTRFREAAGDAPPLRLFDARGVERPLP